MTLLIQMIKLIIASIIVLPLFFILLLILSYGYGQEEGFCDDPENAYVFECVD